ncbi:hypothetical protein Sango_2145600 [Sesamum angolense]|uniref:Transposase MuDR plant domain-containing protein n=1 Tax=Sesamum angolense TaxID=2727404 RepID=A0AAE1WCF9_9LAMI|nr:hypothetical protein Sango_2145600 [Sesamum angolense]
MVFSTKKEFREAVHSHAIKTSRNLKITSNDQRRIYAKCGEQGCNWHCHALKIKNEASFQIREYNPNQCARTYNVKNVNSSWLSKKYIDAFRADPKKNVKGFRNEAIREIRCNVSPFQAYRAKRRAIKEIEGDYDEQYAILWDYAHELKMKNPGSTVIMGLSDGTEENKKFDRLYICFKALKEGFLSGYKQKGLLPAFENIFPARATTVHEFDKCITEIGEMNVKCKEWLIEKPAAQWSRSHFNPWPKCDTTKKDVSGGNLQRNFLQMKKNKDCCSTEPKLTARKRTGTKNKASQLQNLQELQ